MRRPGYLGDYDGIFDWFRGKKEKEENSKEVAKAVAKGIAEGKATPQKDKAVEEEVVAERPEGCPPCPPCGKAVAAGQNGEKPKKKWWIF